ncbi:MAG: class I SAM-dependent methyltransferase [Desulfurococcales archaeon]|nr:class I SAM-dependent methyltransferase [Desulfurococcales archaeon]MCE4621807.1 class I SAM-dependent methyltransferase [Desulfurococcales archaeon]
MTEIDWHGLVSDIELLATAGCYEKVNQVLSLGLVNSLRREAARLVLKGEGVYADLGAGPGTSAKVIKEDLEGSTLILVDPSIPMLSISLENVRDPRILRFGGRFEQLPFKDNSIDGITAMFSYRDAVDYYAALDEIARVLKPDGRLAILDFYRHTNRLIHSLVKLYVFVMVPVALLATLCPKHLSTYKSFLASLDRMLTDKDLVEELEKRFETVKMLGKAPGVAIFYAANPRGKG